MKPLTIVLAAAAFVTASTVVLADNAVTYFSASNPRIIIVPQRGVDAREVHASVRRVVPSDIDDEATPAPRRAVKTEIRPQPRLPLRQQAKAPVRTEQPARRKPLNVAVPEPEPQPEPEPAGPRRALLSAPPPPPAGPTLRFGAPMPEGPAPLTMFTPPPAPAVADEPDAAAAPTITAHAPASVAPSDDDDDDQLPPPGDPRLAPPEPRR